MGTTADKLQKILDSKNAIKTKFNLADDLPFAEYVNNISGSGADVTLGVVDAEGRFQPLTFDVLNGEIVNAPEEVTAFYTWDSPLEAPDMGISDLSFITATAEDILAGKVGADTEGNPVTGTLVKGTDVSGTTALAADVLEGKKFYTADGAFETGTLVKGTDVSDTTATASDVLTGKKFYDADGQPTIGTLVQGGGTGGGGSATYYKCAEVGLPHVEMFEPVFSAPLSAQSDTAETGQSLTTTGTVTYQEVDGRQCAYFNGRSLISCPVTALPGGSSRRTVTAWVKCSKSAPTRMSIVGYGVSAENEAYNMELRNGTFGIFGEHNADNEGYATATFDASQWHLLTVVHEGITDYFYIDGVAAGSFEYARNTSANGTLYIGNSTNYTSDGGFPMTGYIADVRIYNVALSEEKIMQLYDPTYEPPEALAPYTWTGYKAYLVEDTENDEKYYDFEETLTTDTLTWGNGFTPEVGSVYDAEAMVKASLYTVGQ